METLNEDIEAWKRYTNDIYVPREVFFAVDRIINRLLEREE